MTQIVVDASVALAWALTTQKTPAAEALRTIANIDFVAPFIFGYEVRNGLRKAEREKRISSVAADQVLAEFQIVIEVLEPPDSGLLAETMQIARAFNLSYYDACYLELAKRNGCTLATRDGALINNASKAGVTIYDAR